MIIGGLQKNSFIDYPGKISCVVFLAGCNFSCPYCHNPDLVRNGKDKGPVIDEESVLYFLEKRRGLLDGVVISGGEPTLNPDLIVFCKKIQNIGYPIKLDTNGSRPDVIRAFIDEGLPDYIAMDVKTDPLLYSPLIQKDCNPDRILDSIRLIMESDLDYEFRTTCLTPFVDEKIVTIISRIIEGAKLYALQRFYSTRVLDAGFCTDNCHEINDRELIHFQSIASKCVMKCIIR